MPVPIELGALCFTALTIGLAHTLAGPDHYVPFVAMSRVGKWSLKKTLLVTLLCGIGHVGSSVVLGFIGVALGLIVDQLTEIEGVRGDLAGWLLIAFGVVYLAWGLWRAMANRPHTHLHVHLDGTFHAHEHAHSHLLEAEHSHEHATAAARMTPWVLLTIFVFGPCEPLIPMLMYPAAQASVAGVVSVTAIFSLATLGAMLGMVALLHLGTAALAFQRLERYSHAAAGLVVLSCGVAIKCGL